MTGPRGSSIPPTATSVSVDVESSGVVSRETNPRGSGMIRREASQDTRHTAVQRSCCQLLPSECRLASTRCGGERRLAVREEGVEACVEPGWPVPKVGSGQAALRTAVQ
jgi:hypothetical protein